MRLVTVLAVTLTATILLGLATAQATPRKRLDERTQVCRILDFYNSGWVSEGSQIFEESCKKCHYRDNDKGATFLHSETKSMKAWNRVFFERYPQCAKSGEWASLSEEQLQKLNDYLFRNAAHTYNPNDAADCG